MSEENAGGTVETPSIEELQEQLAQERETREKAEAKIVELKKSSKPKEKSEDEKSEDKPKDDTTPQTPEWKKEIFFIKNPEAEEYSEKIDEVIGKYNMSLEDAYEFVQIKYAKSKDEEDFSTKSSTPPKDLKDYTTEESVKALKDGKITRSEYLKIQRDKGELR